MTHTLSFARTSSLARALVLGSLAIFASTASAVSDPLAATLLHDFNDGNEGFNPNAGLLLGVDGQFYGSTTLAGNGGGAGTVFRISPTGTFANLHGFTNTEASQSVATLVVGADGNFYGTSVRGGANEQGTVYRVTPLGIVTILYSFAGPDGSAPVGALKLASDGNFYGTTQRGGTIGGGTAFRITPAGVLTTIHSFVIAEGVLPTGTLVQASDGNFYGTAAAAGPNPDSDSGTVFRMTPAGVVTVVHTFDGTSGSRPFAGLTIGSNGSFYGSTLAGGASDAGVAFSMNTVGVYTVLHTFTGADGSSPRGALIQGIDAAFYGTTQFGGTFGKGVAYKVSSAGVFSVLYNFDNPVGNQPLSEITVGPDGGYYGTTTSGGRESGSVYRLLPKYTFLVPAEDGDPFTIINPIAYLRGKTLTDVAVVLTNPSTATVTVPFTITSTNRSPLEYYIVEPANYTLVFQPGQTLQNITIRTKFPASYLQCNNKLTITIGPASNAAPGDITVNTLTIVNRSPITAPILCR